MSPLSLRRLSDERLSGRLASGEAAAFDELYRRYVHRLAAYGGHLLGDPAAGEDVAHVALMNAYQALRMGRLPGHVRPWLYRIAHNAAVDTLTRRRELLRADVRTADEEDTRDLPAIRGAILDALAALPDRQRRAYVLRELHGLRVAEIAAELSLHVPQVEQALFSARNRMAELLVFGERLSCDSARRLAGGPLDWAERKAVRSHARSCPSCRTALGRRGAALGLLPATDWLRGLAAAATGGGGGVAVAKVGAAAATATLVAGLPAAHDLASHRERASTPTTKTRPEIRHVAAGITRMLVVEPAARRRAQIGRDDGGGDGRGKHSHAEARHEGEARTGTSSASENGDRSGDSGPETRARTSPETTTSRETSPEISRATNVETSGPSGSPTLTDGGHDGSGSGALELIVDESEGSGSSGTDPGSSGSDSGSSGGSSGGETSTDGGSTGSEVGSSGPD